MQTYDLPAVHPEGDGPWADEPDMAVWVDPTTDLNCLVIRGPLGSLFGYVGVSLEHPWHGGDWKLYRDEVEVHGGLNFSGYLPVPAPLPADLWWFGFDCAHAQDESPNLVAELARLGHRSNPKLHNFRKYRTFAYVQGEVTDLADQISVGR